MFDYNFWIVTCAHCLLIRIKHAYILDDPFDDPPQLAELIPEASPEGKPKDEVLADALQR
jgi:hypothetical protein